MKIGELTYSIGAVWDKNSLSAMKSSYSSFLGSIIAAVSVSSLALFAKNVAGINDELGKMARNRDVAIDFLQGLQYSLESSGVSGSKAAEVLQKIQEQREGFIRGKADYEALARVGVDPTAFSTNEAFFNAVIDGLKNVRSESEKADLAKRLLGSSDFKNLIDGGSEAIRKQKEELKELGVLVSQQDFKASAEFNDTMLKTTTVLKGMANKVFTSLLPMFTKLLKQFNAFLQANKKLIQSGLKTFITWIVNGLKFFFSLVGRVVDHLGGMKVVVSVIAGLLLVWQLPLIIMIGLITGVLLALDDVVNYVKGNDSLLGDWLGDVEDFSKNFPKLSMVVKATFDTMLPYFQQYKETLFSLWDLITGKIDFGTFMQRQLDSMTKFLESMKGLLKRFGEWILEIFAKLDIAGAIKRQLDNVKESIFGLFNDFGLSLRGSIAQDYGSPAYNTTAAGATYYNTYNIDANVDASTRSVAEVLGEVSNPLGYGK